MPAARCRGAASSRSGCSTPGSWRSSSRHLPRRRPAAADPRRPAPQRAAVPRCSASSWPSSATSARRWPTCARRGRRRARRRRRRGGRDAPVRRRRGARRPARNRQRARSADPPMTCVIAIDAGTTGIRSRAVFVDGRPGVSSYREFAQHFPQPGWVEHDADGDLGGRAGDARPTSSSRSGAPRWRPSASRTSARRSWPGTARPGEPYGRAIVWQDRRTAARCDELAAAGALDLVRDAHRARARPVLQRHEVRVAAARAACPDAPTSRSARSTPGSSGTSPVARCWRPTPRTPAARCCSTSRRCSGTPSCASCCTSRSSACPTSCRRAGGSA